ncbi:hypothetical protein CEXT_256161 [Caerostris extrusa]|uniref:Uncharacterized protein n=1 Tax=Caerostris extrusa TaxID=172846 RepID=A0AAV4PEV2_CAEEX|nr:hypothetical protein CEXT_256161 [Caerostris extrusa]
MLGRRFFEEYSLTTVFPDVPIGHFIYHVETEVKYLQEREFMPDLRIKLLDEAVIQVQEEDAPQLFAEHVRFNPFDGVVRELQCREFQHGVVQHSAQV